MRRLAALLVALVVMITPPLWAQQDDKSFLETWLETNLSSAGREVRITGFTGALSSQATLDELTIADDDGIWLALRGVQLDWTRSALLAGRLEIDTLHSDEIEIIRRPLPDTDLPQTTASSFALPELPVSIDIGKITAKRLVLGTPVLGVAAVMRLDGSGQLNAGTGQAQLSVERIDGAMGTLRLDGSYANDTRHLALDLALSEGANGLVATLTGLANGAPLSLNVAGAGPIEDFTADITLATDGQSRLSGQVSLAADAPATDAALGFRATLTGDPSPLFPDDYARFFGPDVQLLAEGERHPNGTIDLPTLQIRTQAMEFTGATRINPLGWIDRAQIAGTISAPDGTAVLLPLGGTPTRLNRARVQFDFDSARGPDWTGSGTVTGLVRDDISLGALRLTGTGTLAPGADGQAAQIAGTVKIDTKDIAPSDPALAAAIGDALSGQITFSKRDQARVRLGQITLRGGDYDLSGQASFGMDWQHLNLLTTGDVTLNAQDLSRFAALAGQAISGAANLRITGAASLMSGPFDLIVDGTGQDLAIGIDEFDRPFAGASDLSFAAIRDAKGTRIEDFAINSTGAAALATATLAPGNSHVTAHVDMPDGGLLLAGLDGALSLDGTMAQTDDIWQVDLSAAAPGDTVATLAGQVILGRDGLSLIQGGIEAQVGSLAAYSRLAGRSLSGGTTLSVQGQFDVATQVSTLGGTLTGRDLGFGLGSYDRLTAGDSQARFAVQRDGNGTIHIDDLDLATPELSAQVTTADDGALQFTARMRDLGVVVPGLSGAFTTDGHAQQTEAGWQVALAGAGPGGTDMTVSGVVAANGALANLALRGRAPLALANPFIAPRQLDGLAVYDLALNGAPTLAALSGTVTVNGARAALPHLRMSLDPINATVRIANQQARIETTAAVSSGGQVSLSGPIGLTAPHAAHLTIRVDRVGLTDPTLYDTIANGIVTLDGPLTQGALLAGTIDLAAVELRIPETGFGVDGSLPELTHIGASADVQATRARAGLTGQGARPHAGTVFALDLTISAPDQVFLRGRGLDAELGGALRIGGTTRRIETQGGFQLIRGRLDLLGNRLILTEATATLQGSLALYILIKAKTAIEDVSILISIEGPATDPLVSFTSSPDLPEDEILARLVFGQGLTHISPFQALKLASAVATLSGHGGAGTISRLRTGFGLGDLDVTTGDDGQISLRAGAYLSDNLYSDVNVGTDGQTDINLNLTVTPDVTVRGQVSSDGDTGIGIFFERDY